MSTVLILMRADCVGLATNRQCVALALAIRPAETGSALPIELAPAGRRPLMPHVNEG